MFEKCIVLILTATRMDCPTESLLPPIFFESTALCGENSGAKRSVRLQAFHPLRYDQHKILFSASTDYELEPEISFFFFLEILMFLPTTKLLSEIS
jgi:hypothetical protein